MNRVICIVVTLLALSSTFSSTAAAKPFYITVNRAFTPNESPVVDVAFMDKEPVELRVLKPKDLERYLQGQENLRRSWDRPVVTENPGRALSRGLNHVKTPGTYLLYALSPSMRKALGAKIAEREGESETTTYTILAEGPKKLVDVPADMELVRRQMLNLDLGGDPRAFDVPGFEGWSRTSSGFEERRVKLAPLPAGVYVLQLVQGHVEGQVVLVVSDLTMQVKQTDGALLARVASTTSQAPVEGASIIVRQRGQKPITAKTNAQGEAQLAITEPKLLVTAQKGTDTAIVDTDFYSTLAIAPDVFLYSDRPIYKPGDTVQFRGILRKPDGFLARLFSPTKSQVTVSLIGSGVSQNAQVASIKATVDALGSFSGTLKTPDDAPEGVYRITASVDGAPHVGEVRVQAYVKPTFFLEMKTDKDSVEPGGIIKATVKAERYAGGAPQSTAYEVTLTRTLLESPAWVDDAGLGGEGSAVTYGSTSTTEGKLSVPERLYSSVAERVEAGTGDWYDTWESAPLFDDDGSADIEIKVPALKAGDDKLSYTYVLSVRARDDQGTFAASSQRFFLSPTDVMGSLRLNAKVHKQSGTAELVVRSTTLGGKEFPNSDGAVVFTLRTAAGDEREVSKATFKTDAHGQAKVTVPTDKVGAVYAAVTLKDDKGAPWTGEERVLVVGDKGEAVEWVPELSLTTLKTVASPGETVQVIALLPEEWGQNGKEQGPVWVTLSGTTIFSTKLQQVSGRTVVLPVVVEKRFGSAVYVSVGYPTRSGRWSERTLPLRIVPKERVLTVQTTAANSEAAPLGQQTVSIKVTDHRGKGVVSSVSLSVVDKAVYAVQPEFRPKVLEFFYPLVRNNVADFFSAEFQGYGYGHELARRLGAVSGVQFAMVKPPKKKNDERDTAYWSGNIVTDKTGAATVTFQLPSNQTLWTMTAVAADAAGRVGEGTGQFASRGKVIVHAAAPEFLRKGDEAQASVRVSRGAASNDGDWKKPVSVNVDGVGITAQAAATPFELKSKTSESVIPVTLRATAPGAVLLKVNVEGAPQQVSLQRHIDVDDATLSDIIAVSSAGGGQLTLKPDSGAQVDNVELIIQSGIADAIMADVRELLIYPHGCLEQLVATTAPPVSLLLVLEAQQRFSGLDADSQLLLSEARSRAQLGTSRIVAYANGGGFAWFPSAPASVEMTITALGGLAASHKAGLLAGQQAVVDKAVQWLDSQGNLSPYQEAWRAYVIALHAPQRAQARARAAVQSALANPSPLVGALAVLAAAEAGIANEAGTKDDVAKLAAEARAAFLSKTRVAAIDAWDFPLFDTGTAALLGHAAQRAPGDTAPIKQRFLELFADETLSTLDRATLIQHSLWLVAEDAARAGAMTPPKVTGAEVMFTPRGFGLASTLRDGTTSVSVERFDGVATLRATQRVPLSSATTPISDGFTISRSYWSVGSGAKTPITEGAAVAQGDLVWVQLKVDLRDEGYAGGAGRSAYSVIEDHLPAGFSPVREDKLYRGAPLSLPLVTDQVRQRTFSPKSVTFYVQEKAWWMGTTREVGYVMRADFPGTFIAPPASVNDMYQSKAKARTAVATLRIQPSTNAK